MHGRIFEISTKPFKSEREHMWFDFEDVPYLPPIVTYVENSMQRDIDISYFRKELSRYKGIIFDEAYFIINNTFKADYFEDRYKEFKKSVESLSFVSLIPN